MKRAIYNKGVKVADGIVIKEGCTEYEIASFALLLLTKYANTAFRYPVYGKSVAFKKFIDKLLLIKVMPSFMTEYTTWVTNKGHMVSVLRERKNGTYYIIIGEDNSENFYPMIIETANAAISHGPSSDLPIDFPKKENHRFKVISRYMVHDYIFYDEPLMCEYKDKKYYIYDDSTISNITFNMLYYGVWYIYDEE